MRSGCSSFVVVCNLFVARVLWPNLHLAYRAKRCFRRLDPRFVKAAAVTSTARRVLTDWSLNPELKA